MSELVSFEIVTGVELNNGSRLCYLVFGMAGNNQARAGACRKAPQNASRLRSEPKHAAEAPGVGFLRCLGTELGIAVRSDLEFVVNTMG